MHVLTISKDGLKNVNLNRRKAIHGRCLNCTGWSPSDVSRCALITCRLHPFRMGQGKQDALERKKAIRAYCLCCMNDQVGEVTKCPSSNCALFAYRKGGLEQALNDASFDKKVHIEEVISINEGTMDKERGASVSFRKTMPMQPLLG